MLIQLSREIVDESDVYVDVHKAIRRLTPAPRIKCIHPDAAISSTATKRPGDGPILVDVVEATLGEAGTTAAMGTAEVRIDNDGPDARPKTAIFMKRRSSAGPDGKPGVGTIPVKASLDEMKQQLRLGPANRATQPRSMRTNVFKIKQGLRVTTFVGPSSSDRHHEENGHARLEAYDEDHEAEGLEEDPDQTPLLGTKPMNGGLQNGQYGTTRTRRGR